MGNLKVGTKIYTGFFVILFLLVTLSVLSYDALEKDDESLHRVSSANNLMLVLMRKEVDLGMLRRQALGVLTSNNQASFDEAKASYDKTVASLRNTVETYRKLVEEGGGQAELRVAKESARLLDLYTQQFATALDLRGTRDALMVEKLTPLGEALSRKLEENIALLASAGRAEETASVANLLKVLMMARLESRQFLAAPTKEEKEAVARWIEVFVSEGQKVKAVFEEMITDAALLQKLDLDGLVRSAQEYKGIFGQVAEKTMDYQAMFSETMMKTAEEFNTLVEDAVADQGKDLKETTDLAQKIGSSATQYSILLSAFAIIFGVVVAWLISRNIVGALHRMTEAMGRLAGGDLRVTIPALNQKDEIGQMAQAVQVFKDNAIRIETMQAEQEEQKVRAEEEKRRLMMEMADSFEASVKGVVQTVSSASAELQSSAGGMTDIVRNVEQEVEHVVSASSQASGNVQTVAVAAEELSSSIHEISRQVTHSSKMTGSAVEQAERTNIIVQGLADAAQKIGEVVNLINDIASQTNLLALNATIEAARAGDAGKGFAVVAGEVKNLANQTARATEEISGQISSVQETTKEAVEAIRGIAATIGEIDGIASAIASAVEEQGAATQEIARNVEQAADGTSQVSGTIGSISSAVNESGHAAEQVLSAAHELSQQAEVLSSEVDSFISRIRAG